MSDRHEYKQAVGKTVSSVVFDVTPNGGDPYVMVTFTDGTWLTVTETQQAGWIGVEFGGKAESSN